MPRGRPKKKVEESLKVTTPKLSEQKKEEKTEEKPEKKTGPVSSKQLKKSPPPVLKKLFTKKESEELGKIVEFMKRYYRASDNPLERQQLKEWWEMLSEMSSR